MQFFLAYSAIIGQIQSGEFLSFPKSPLLRRSDAVMVVIFLLSRVCCKFYSVKPPHRISSALLGISLYFALHTYTTCAASFKEGRHKSKDNTNTTWTTSFKEGRPKSKDNKNTTWTASFKEVRQNSRDNAYSMEPISVLQEGCHNSRENTYSMEPSVL